MVVGWRIEPQAVQGRVDFVDRADEGHAGIVRPVAGAEDQAGRAPQGERAVGGGQRQDDGVGARVDIADAERVAAGRGKRQRRIFAGRLVPGTAFTGSSFTLVRDRWKAAEWSGEPGTATSSTWTVTS